MATFFFDSSALVKCYIKETGTVWARSLVDAQPPNEIVIAQVTGVEIIAAITRRLRAGATTPTDAAQAISAFRNDFQSGYEVVAVSTSLIEEAMNLAELHGLRGYDAVQLAAATTFEAQMTARGVGPLTLISADNELNQAAQAEGLLTDDPNQH
ncbi:MAG: type II toxin-antitoxin system VapC family toxin [Blastocatellia bacterium]